MSHNSRQTLDHPHFVNGEMKYPDEWEYYDPLLVKCLGFVFLATKDFDESHDFDHAVQVMFHSRTIWDEIMPDATEEDTYIVTFSALLHDIIDPKYKVDGALKQVEDFVTTELGA